MGETFEDFPFIVKLFEETGIRVKNIRYFGSQPWAFRIKMVGFLADYDSGEINCKKQNCMMHNGFLVLPPCQNYRQQVLSHSN